MNKIYGELILSVPYPPPPSLILSMFLYLRKVSKASKDLHVWKLAS